eukprot:12493623-Alexandrium_andersonii.AAC.1
MSASLVGSEMCIRDRIKVSSGPKIQPEGAAVPARPTGQMALSEAPNGRPVSYTHLTLPTICSV